MTPRELLKFLPIERFHNPAATVAVIRLDGVIGPRQWRTALSLGSHANALDRAFALSGLSGVALAINSPGGSPVQSALLFRRIRQLAEEKGVPVFAFAEDVAASGGYWLALAGDEIYAEEASLIGSIGVVTAGFGLDRLIERFGVERLMWGSNFPMDNRRDIGGLLRLAQEQLAFLSESDRARLFGGNALRLWPFS